MSQSKKAAKSVLIIIIFSLGSKILGFIREMLIAAKFGSGAETDTFFIALTAITLFNTMIVNSINTTMIPVLSEIESSEGKIGKRKHTNNLLNIVFIISIIMIILAWLLAPIIIKILATGFEGPQLKMAILLMRIGLPAIIFASVQGVFRGYLQSESLFIESAAANFPFNFVYIFFLIFLSGIFGIKGLMVTSVLAIGSQIILQIPGIKSVGYRYNAILDFKDKYIKKIIYLIPPVIMSTTIGDINSIVDKSMASNLISGSISALNYANRLNSLVIGIFISAITTVLFPTLSKEANKDNYSGLKRVTISGINIILLITIPASIGMMVLAKPIVKLAFERGVFDTTATYMTAGALLFYAIGLSASAVRTLLYRIFYSLQDTKTPMINSFASLVINIIFNLLLIRYMAHRGLALATSIASIVSTLFLLFLLKGKIGSFGFSKSIKCGIKSLGASITMGIVASLIYNILEKSMGTNGIYEFIILFISIGLGALLYFIIIYLLKIDEVKWVIKIAKEKALNSIKKYKKR